MKNRVVRLRDVASLNISNRRQNEKKIAYLDTGNIIENRVIKIQYFDYLDNIPSRAKRKVKEEDTIFSMVRPNQKHFGYINRSMENLIVSTGFSVVTPNKNKINSRYLFYLLTNNEVINIFQKLAEGCVSTYPTLSLRDLLDFEFKLPSLEEQKRIADILTALDDKIELNNQMNQTLEEIASLLYKRWFVDFEFPDDKGNPYKSSGGEMVDSELGMIPKGWEVKELGEFITLINGYAFKSGSYSKDGNYKIITIKNVLDNKFITNSTNKILEIPDNVIENQKLKIGDVLISLTGNVGRVCVVTEGECLLNQRVAKIISKIEVNKYYWRTFFNTEEIKIKMINISKGTAQSNLSTIEIMKIKILNSKEVTYNFSEKIKAISKKKLQNEIMILNIEMIKQKLLEELV